ncbi:unnamed protein product [Amoebophrya sp. A25]|nr:unnamed protein product [Amoebophrya sp. A25]|eukprot:GSA25T00023283001.1
MLHFSSWVRGGPPRSGDGTSNSRTGAPVRCQEGSSSDPFLIAGAFMDLGKQVPLSPAHDVANEMKVHRWGFDPVPQGQLMGQRQHGELLDGKNHSTPVAPFATDARGFHPKKPSEDRINQSYENMLGDELSLAAVPAGKIGSKWQKNLAYFTGLYRPRSMGPAKSADDIRLSVNEFGDRIQQDDPNSACKYLLLEEARCLATYQYEKQPLEAGKRCVKWFDEFQKCRWDQHKFDNGYTPIEGPALGTKRRPYIYYPDFKYA